MFGTDCEGRAWGAGTLELFYWDSNAPDNADFVTATLATVPESSTWAMTIAGFGLVGAVGRRRRAVVTAA